MAGLIGAALCITARGGGFEGWAVIAAVVTMVSLVGGILAARARRRRRAHEMRTITYTPDNPR
ncbi:hypothetical protein ACFTWF_24290 [Rhodococcus sp. NPDC056960]|uniref:hypothetical protein n=1 Tax=Rhodococcus sp. NPDC056960 TaxID=3345982 RepID=UPI00362923B3